jgi:hypothetical protein
MSSEQEVSITQPVSIILPVSMDPLQIAGIPEFILFETRFAPR